jgi:ABC-type molybdate transport system ATPase subunit
MLPQKQLLPRSAPSQNLRWQRLNPAHLANHATQTPAAELNLHALKFVAPSAAMMFGILQANHNARVAKSQPELALRATDMKMTAQPARHVSTTTKHRLAHRAHVVKMHQLVVHHVHIEMKLQHAHLAPRVTKYMRQSLACRVRSLRQNA